MVLSGEIYQEDVKIYDIPECEPLTYYISSLSAFVDDKEKRLDSGEIDTVYMSGVQAIKDRNYKRAITFLHTYQDYNSAVAFCALDYNASALAILERLPKTDKVNYMLAIVYSRLGETEKAVRCYEEACRMNPGFVHRGNLDPEITQLSVFR